MTHQIFRLVPKPGAGFHFGREGHELEGSSETLPSDSLFSALISTYAELFEGIDEFLDQFNGAEPPFVTSSLFPYVGDLPLFPMPRLKVELRDENVSGRRKKLKKLKYVSPIILGKLLRGEPMDDLFGDAGPEFSLQNGEIWFDHGELDFLPNSFRIKGDKNAVRANEKVWKTEPVPRVTIDRITNQTTIFYAGRTVFSDHCGLWFLADVQDYGDLLMSLVEDLGMRGIGGERSTGYGSFAVATEKFNAFSPNDLPISGQNTPRVMTLSRYLPRPEELHANVLQGGASYELVTIGGWLASIGNPAQRRKRIRMIEVGSILDTPQGMPIIGQIVDVRPEYDSTRFPHPVYRNGFALTIGVHAERERVET